MKESHLEQNFMFYSYLTYKSFSGASIGVPANSLQLAQSGRYFTYMYMSVYVRAYVLYIEMVKKNELDWGRNIARQTRVLKIQDLTENIMIYFYFRYMRFVLGCGNGTERSRPAVAIP
jgi:hypothetical protein